MEANKSKTVKNKYVKGFLSLLREFIMIIVGILLALQIDGWVSDKAEKSELHSDLDYVIEDHHNNKTELEKTKNFKEESIAFCTELIDKHHTKESMKRDDIVVALSSILKTNKFDIDQSGFERIKTSPLYESTEFFQVRDKIREYNTILSDLRYSERFINSYIELLSLEMSKNGKLLSVFEYLRMKNGIAQYKAELPDFKLEELLNDNKPLQAALHKYEIDAPTLLENYTKLLQAGKELHTTIKRYLD